MIYETGGPGGPALPVKFFSFTPYGIYAHCIDSLTQESNYSSQLKTSVSGCFSSQLTNVALTLHCSGSSNGDNDDGASCQRRNQGPSTVFFEQDGCLGGKQRRFSCANVSQSARSNHRPPSSPEIGGLRRGLNNLAALCRRALGSQPSKVMTERRRLTSPPIHSHYHLFTVTDSRQTKHRGHIGPRRVGGGRGIIAAV